MATIVSWPLVEMIISLVITNSPGQDGQDGREGQEGEEGSDPFPPLLPFPPFLPLPQFVNLRMRTLSTSPNPASVAIIDEPP